MVRSCPSCPGVPARRCASVWRGAPRRSQRGWAERRGSRRVASSSSSGSRNPVGLSPISFREHNRLQVVEDEGCSGQVAIKLMSEGDLAAHVDEVAAYVDVRKGAMFGTLSFADDRDKQRFRLSRMRTRDLQRGRAPGWRRRRSREGSGVSCRMAANGIWLIEPCGPGGPLCSMKERVVQSWLRVIPCRVGIYTRARFRRLPAPGAACETTYSERHRGGGRCGWMRRRPQHSPEHLLRMQRRAAGSAPRS